MPEFFVARGRQPTRHCLRRLGRGEAVPIYEVLGSTTMVYVPLVVSLENVAVFSEVGKYGVQPFFCDFAVPSLIVYIDGIFAYLRNHVLMKVDCGHVRPRVCLDARVPFLPVGFVLKDRIHHCVGDAT